MSGVAFCFGSLGVVLYCLISGTMFDQVGRNSPFIILGSSDAFIFVLSIFFGCLGYLKYERKTEQGDEQEGESEDESV